MQSLPGFEGYNTAFADFNARCGFDMVAESESYLALIANDHLVYRDAFGAPWRIELNSSTGMKVTIDQDLITMTCLLMKNSLVNIPTDANEMTLRSIYTGAYKVLYSPSENSYCIIFNNDSRWFRGIASHPDYSETRLATEAVFCSFMRPLLSLNRHITINTQ